MSQNLIFVPVEPLSERYTEQWYRRMPKEFEAAGFQVTVIDGVPLIDDDIKVGTFLDINSTVHYKMSQLMLLSKMFNDGRIADGTVFFFADIEFWGLESIRLMADMNKVEVKITGFLHAASYTEGDAFEIAAPYQRFTEMGWLSALDKVFVGSQYHANILYDRRIKWLAVDRFDSSILRDKVKVTKNPVFVDEYKFAGLPKQKKIMLTNRLDAEKHPVRTLNLFAHLARSYTDWEFVLTSGRKTLRGDYDAVNLALKMKDQGLLRVEVGLTKDQYHAELETAAIVVSHSEEESYGYCIAEALHYKALPYLINAASHREFVGTDLLFTRYDEAAKLRNLMDAWSTPDWPECPALDTNGMQNIINELRTL